MDSKLSLYNKTKILRILISSGAEIFEPDVISEDADYRQWLILKNMRRDDIEIFKFLIESYPDLLNYRSHLSKSLLMIAADKSYVKIVKYLLAFDMKNVAEGKPTMLNFKNKYGLNALTEAVGNEYPREGKDTGKDSTMIVKLLIDADFYYRRFLPGYKSIIFDTNRRGGTALLFAARQNNIGAIRLLLRVNPAALTVKDVYGDFPLKEVVGYEPSSAVPLILKYITKDNLWTVDEALEVCESEGYYMNMNMLIDAISKYRAPSKVPKKHEFPNGSLEKRMARYAKHRYNMVKTYLEFGVNSDARDEHGNTALMNAINMPEIIELLLKAGARPNLKNKGMTALMLATDEKAVKILAEKSSLNIMNNSGMTALNLAARDESALKLMILLKAGANMSVNKSATTCLMTAILSNRDTNVLILLKQDRENVKLKRKSILNVLYQGMTVLQWLIHTENGKYVKYFLETIDDLRALNYRNDEDETPLMYAVRINKLSIIELFVECTNEDVLNAVNDKGNNPLMFAIERKNLNAINVLLEADRKIVNEIFKVVNKKGMSALDIARTFDDDEILNILLKANES